MKRKDIYEICKSLEALRERVTSFVDPQSYLSENDILLLDMRFHLSKAIQLARKLKGGVK